MTVSMQCKKFPTQGVCAHKVMGPVVLEEIDFSFTVV